MATIIEAPESNFVAHPEGSFIAILRDTYLKTRPNPYKGKLNEKGNEDTRETITELFMEFLTSHMVDVNGKMMPGFVRYVATASVSEKSNLRKFVQAWFPKLKDENYKHFDADKLLGRGAYITVKHNVSKKGETFANVIAAMQPPPGAILPVIPSDFVRHCDKAAAPAQQAAPVQHTPQPIAQPTPAPVQSAAAVTAQQKAIDMLKPSQDLNNPASIAAGFSADIGGDQSIMPPAPPITEDMDPGEPDEDAPF